MLQWDEFTKIATKLDVPTERYLFSVLLFSDYLTNCLNTVAQRHFHANYEVLYFRHPEEDPAGFFRIIPPGTRHMGALTTQWEGYILTTFQFNLTERALGSSEPSVLDAYRELQQTVDIPDTFQGGGIMKRIHQELQKKQDACFERVCSLFQLLLMELACALPHRKTHLHKISKNTVDDFRAVYVEYFLSSNYANPDCSRAQLADLLGVCERHLVRILDRIYHTTFRDLLTEYRMERAESFRLLNGCSAEEAAVQVGYGSCKGFLKAYQRYHGKAFRSQM